MDFQHRPKGRGSNERGIPRENDEVPTKIPQGLGAAEQRMSRSFLLRLIDEGHSLPRSTPDLIRLVAHDHEDVREARLANGLEDMGDEGGSHSIVEHLGPVRLHPDAFAGGEDDGFRRHEIPFG